MSFLFWKMYYTMYRLLLFNYSTLTRKKDHIVDSRKISQCSIMDTFMSFLLELEKFPNRSSEHDNNSKSTDFLYVIFRVMSHLISKHEECHSL